MKSQRLNVSEDRQTILQRQTQSSKSVSGEENSEPIPIDLIIEIFLRLPAKSIARCPCVSKLWASILSRPYFTELFLTKSSTRPKLLITCEKDGEVFFFSSDQPQNLDENSFSVAPNYHMKSSFSHGRYGLFSSINGLICFGDERIVKGRKNAVLVPVLCNPSTGQSLILPRVKTRKVSVRSFLGYDPIDKQFKLLSMTCQTYEINSGYSMEHQVLTLGTRKPAWRMIECCIPHFSLGKEICINGILYYTAGVNRFSRIFLIVCFDVRSEKFSFIKVMENLIVDYGTLINYNGKLGLLHSDGTFSRLTRESRSIELWVLEDAESHEWSKHIYVFPPLWHNIVVEAESLYIVGIIGANEIVFSLLYLSDPFYLYYYNIEKNTFVRVGVQGMEAFKHGRVHTFLNHVENVELMQAFQDFIA